MYLYKKNMKIYWACVDHSASFKHLTNNACKKHINSLQDYGT